MASKKIRVGIIFGGKSAEHEISLLSAQNIIKAIDKTKYEPVLIGITKEGHWLREPATNYLANPNDPKMIALTQSNEPLVIQPGENMPQVALAQNRDSVEALDVIFPILHGTNGEDGTMQGLLTLLDLPYVGPGVLGSAVGMDKDVTKRLLRDAGIPIASFVTIHAHQKKTVDYQALVDEFGLPMFVKPANAGSSVGVSKISDKKSFINALEHAFTFDNKILVESYIKGREIECAVLGNEDPMASIPGEVIPTHDFYSYEAKYIDENGASVEIPAKLPNEVSEQVRTLACKVFQTLCCEGMARVDFFVTTEHQIYVNEINTIPGFTNISMYPKLWEATGMNQTELIDTLLSLAIDRHKRDKKLDLSFH